MRVEIKVNEGYEVEDVLEKALKTIRAEQEGVLRDPYLLELYNYSGNLYNVLMDAMNEEILDILFGIEKSEPSRPLGKIKVTGIPLKKSYRAGLIKVAVTVNGKHGQYQSHRWIKPNYAKQILDRYIRGRGGDPNAITFKNKTTETLHDKAKALKEYERIKPQEDLITFIGNNYITSSNVIDIKRPEAYIARWDSTQEGQSEFNKLLQSFKLPQYKGISFQNKINGRPISRVGVINFLDKTDTDRELQGVFIENYKIKDQSGNEVLFKIPDLTPINYDDYPIVTKTNWDNVKFFNKQKERKHFINHGHEHDLWVTVNDYIKSGADLLNAPLNDDIISVEVNNEVMRYDKVNNIFVCANVNGTLKTIMIPKGGIEYFERQLKGKI